MLKTKTADKWVALAVIACSIVLFIALAFGLSGRSFVSDAHKIRVRFHDITGIKVSSQVKYAGAPAGVVSAVRMLSHEERVNDKENMVEITLSLLPEVPSISKEAKISIAADTLLSDKFVSIDAESGGASSAEMADVLQGISPTTFDKLARNTDQAVEGLRRTLGGSAGKSADDVISRLQSVLGETESLLVDLKPVIRDARSITSGANKLFSENKDRLQSTLDKLDAASGAIESFGKRSEAFMRNNERNFDRTVADLKTSSENLKITSTYAKFLLQDLAQRPNRLIWGGGKVPTLPSEQQILNSRQPISAP